MIVIYKNKKRTQAKGDISNPMDCLKALKIEPTQENIEKFNLHELQLSGITLKSY